MKKDLDPELWADFVTLAQSFASLMQGDTHRIDAGYAILDKYGLDEYGYSDEEEDDTPNPPPKPKKAVD